MKSHPRKSIPEEVIAALPVVRQDMPTVTRLRAGLQRLRRLLTFSMVMGIFSVAWILVGGGLMMILIKIFPTLVAQSEQPGTPMRILMLFWFAMIPINFLVGLGMPAVLPFWIDWRMRGREALFCDTQLVGDLI